jgi:hypothetical protein
MTEIFGAGISGRPGWVDIVPSTPAVKGFFILFDDALTAIDGAGFSGSPSSSLIFPKVTSDTTVTFINTSSKVIESAAFLLFDKMGLRTGRLTSALFRIQTACRFDSQLRQLQRLCQLNAADDFQFQPRGSAGFETYRNRPISRR